MFKTHAMFDEMTDQWYIMTVDNIAVKITRKEALTLIEQGVPVTIVSA